MIPGARRKTRSPSGGKPSEQFGPALKSSNHPLPGDVAIVAPEQLVPAISGKCHGDFAPGKLAHEERRNLRRIRERLIEHLRQIMDNRQSIATAQSQLCVICTQVSCYRPGVRRLVEIRLIEANGERFDRSIRRGLHQCDDRRRVDSTGQERTQRNIGLHAQPDSVR